MQRIRKAALPKPRCGYQSRDRHVSSTRDRSHALPPWAHADYGACPRASGRVLRAAAIAAAFKQRLMISAIDRYTKDLEVFPDEDLRADRHPSSRRSTSKTSSITRRNAHGADGRADFRVVRVAAAHRSAAPFSPAWKTTTQWRCTAPTSPIRALRLELTSSPTERTSSTSLPQQRRNLKGGPVGHSPYTPGRRAHAQVIERLHEFVKINGARVLAYFKVNDASAGRCGPAVADTEVPAPGGREEDTRAPRPSTGDSIFFGRGPARSG